MRKLTAQFLLDESDAIRSEGGLPSCGTLATRIAQQHKIINPRTNRPYTRQTINRIIKKDAKGVALMDGNNRLAGKTRDAPVIIMDNNKETTLWLLEQGIRGIIVTPSHKNLGEVVTGHTVYGDLPFAAAVHANSVYLVKNKGGKFELQHHTQKQV